MSALSVAAAVECTEEETDDYGPGLIDFLIIVIRWNIRKARRRLKKRRD